MGKFDNLMEKKKDGPAIDENHKAAKMSMLKALRDEMSGMMAGDLKPGMKKVEVAGDSPDALSAGLDKAKDMLGGEGDESNEDTSGGNDESVEMAMGKYLESPDKQSIEDLIKELQAKADSMGDEDEDKEDGGSDESSESEPKDDIDQLT